MRVIDWTTIGWLDGRWRRDNPTAKEPQEGDQIETPSGIFTFHDNEWQVEWKEQDEESTQEPSDTSPSPRAVGC